MKTLLRVSCILGALLFHAYPTEALSLWDSKGPFVNQLFVDGRAGGYREGGGVGAFGPIWGCPDRLLFGEFVTGYWKQEYSLSVGVGYRQLTSFGVAFGGNAWFDFAHTDQSVDFYQGGLGGELIGGCWGVRGNLYLAVRNQHLLREVTTASGTFREFQSAWRGGDIEAGYALCCPNGSQVWGWLGYFQFQDGDKQRMQGPRLRLEYRQRDLFNCCGSEAYVGVEWEHDQVRDSEASFIIGLRVPLGPCSPLCCQACTPCARMNEPIWREQGIWTRRVRTFN